MHVAFVKMFKQNTDFLFELNIFFIHRLENIPDTVERICEHTASQDSYYDNEDPLTFIYWHDVTVAQSDHRNHCPIQWGNIFVDPSITVRPLKYGDPGIRNAACFFNLMDVVEPTSTEMGDKSNI